MCQVLSDWGVCGILKKKKCLVANYYCKFIKDVLHFFYKQLLLKSEQTICYMYCRGCHVNENHWRIIQDKETNKYIH